MKLMNRNIQGTVQRHSTVSGHQGLHGLSSSGAIFLTTRDSGFWRGGLYDGGGAWRWYGDVATSRHITGGLLTPILSKATGDTDVDEAADEDDDVDAEEDADAVEAVRVGMGTSSGVVGAAGGGCRTTWADDGKTSAMSPLGRRVGSRCKPAAAATPLAVNTTPEEDAASPAGTMWTCTA